MVEVTPENLGLELPRISSVSDKLEVCSLKFEDMGCVFILGADYLLDDPG